MKLRLILSALVIMSVSILAFCSNEPSRIKGKFFGIDRENIGVVNGKVITIYGYEPSQGWKNVPGNTYTIPSDAEDVSFYGGHIAVLRSTGIVTLYANEGVGRWSTVFRQEENDRIFTFSKDYTRIFSNQIEFALVKGKDIDFYSMGQLMEQWHFTIPDKCSEVLSAGMFIVCVMPNGLDIYEPDNNHKWQLSPNTHFNFTNGKPALLEIPADNAFGIVRGNTVDFYEIRSGHPCTLDHSFTSPR